MHSIAQPHTLRAVQTIILVAPQPDVERRDEVNARRHFRYPVAVSTGLLSKMWPISHR